MRIAIQRDDGGAGIALLVLDYTYLSIPELDRDIIQMIHPHLSYMREQEKTFFLASR